MEAKVDKCKFVSFSGDRKARSVIIFSNDFCNKTYIVLLWFSDNKLIQNVIHKTVALLFVWELNLITINLAWHYNADSEKLQLQLDTNRIAFEFE